MLYVMSFTSLSLTDCINATDLGAQCAGDITGFLNAFATLGGSGSGLGSGNCENLDGVIPRRLRDQLEEMREKHRRWGPKESEAMQQARRDYVRQTPEYKRIMAEVAAKRAPPEQYAEEDKQY